MAALKRNFSKTITHIAVIEGTLWGGNINVMFLDKEKLFSSKPLDFHEIIAPVATSSTFIQ